MKLIVCIKCGDIFNLTIKEKTCSCGKSSGKYIDDLNAEISGDCEPIGFANNTFSHAYKIQKIENKNYDGNKNTCCKGVEFTAFFIPEWATSVKRVKRSVEQTGT